MWGVGDTDTWKIHLTELKQKQEELQSNSFKSFICLLIWQAAVYFFKSGQNIFWKNSFIWRHIYGSFALKTEQRSQIRDERLVTWYLASELLINRKYFLK